jgi:methyl coenzyme M reductase beta subunit
MNNTTIRWISYAVAGILAIAFGLQFAAGVAAGVALAILFYYTEPPSV